MVSTSANGNNVEINLNNREWYKGRRICPRCRINDAFGNFVHCAECLEKISENNIISTHTSRVGCDRYI